MPNISVTAYEPDGQGGWFVEWHDTENLDGQPLTAYIHLTPDTLEELAEARECVGADCSAYRRAQECCGEQPESSEELPPGIQAWLDGYREHVQDCCDRFWLGVKPDAPQKVLEDARAGRGVPSEWRTSDDVDEAFARFRGRHGAG